MAQVEKHGSATECASSPEMNLNATVLPGSAIKILRVTRVLARLCKPPVGFPMMSKPSFQVAPRDSSPSRPVAVDDTADSDKSLADRCAGNSGLGCAPLRREDFEKTSMCAVQSARKRRTCAAKDSQSVLGRFRSKSSAAHRASPMRAPLCSSLGPQRQSACSSLHARTG